MKPEKPGYGLVMVFYLVSGALGCMYFGFLFVYAWLLDQESGRTESVGYFLAFGFPGALIGFLANYGWLLGIFLTTRYRSSWRVMVPAATLVALGALTFVSRIFLLLPSINDVALIFYFLAATLIGVEWLSNRTRRSRNWPPSA